MNSVVVPDEKKSKKGFRYRLSSLKLLWEKFTADENVECSYSQFTRHTPQNVIKPKPEDWGTCLCMICLNPELKIDSLRKVLPEMNWNINNIFEKSEDELNILYKRIEKSVHTFEYLEWSKEKEITDEKTTKHVSYHSKKNACKATAKSLQINLKKKLLYSANIQSE